jgi:hypothetical protein
MGHAVDQDQQFWWNWWVNFAVAAGTFLAVFVALFGEWVRARVFPPRFRLGLVRKEGERTQLTALVSGVSTFIDDVRYYHLRVSNRRRWSPATDVQVCLTRIEEPGRDGHTQVTWVGNVPIRWRDQELVPLLRTLGSAADCDLCRVEKSKGLFLMPLILPNNLIAHRSGKCHLVVHLQARSNQADSEVVRIGINWDGRWENGDKEMQQHLQIDDTLPPEQDSSPGKIANDGIWHYRKILRSTLKRVLRTYGLSRRGIDEPDEMRQTFWDFLIKYEVAAIAFGGFGYAVREFSPILASLSYVLALAVFFRGFWPWCKTRTEAVVLYVAFAMAMLTFGRLDFSWIQEQWTPTFLYLVPTRELVDCERRAFFVNHSGFKRLEDITIIVKDNKSGYIEEVDSFKSGIEPGPQNADAPRYIWFKPSHPWDEDYAITVTGSHFRSVQEIVLRGTKQGLQFAMQITVDANKRAVVKCRDKLLPETYSLGRGSLENCDSLMAVDQGFLKSLRPEPYGFQLFDGAYSIKRIRQLPPPSELDAQSDDRHLTEYMRTIMRSNLSKYGGTKLSLLSTGGPKSLAYAAELRDFFESLGWHVDGPRPVPVGDERLVDIQISVSSRYRNKSFPTATDLLNSLEGIKHRRRLVLDDAISSDLIVVWVGPRSPDNFVADDCAPATLHPIPGVPHTCEVVSQTPGICSFPPK